MSYIKTQGIVLRRIDYSETSLILSCFTRDAGKVRVIAKGAKRLQPKGPWPLDFLSLADIVILEKKSADLDILCEWSMRDCFPHLRESFDRWTYGWYWAELTEAATHEHVAAPSLFSSLCAILAWRSPSQTALALATHAYEMRVANSLGIAPVVLQCVTCGKSWTSREQAFFCAAQGGAMCGACAGNVPGDRFPVSTKALHVLNSLAKAKLAAISKLRVDAATQKEIKTILRVHLTYHLGHPLRMWKVL